jgi:hypothetical protein
MLPIFCKLYHQAPFKFCQMNYDQFKQSLTQASPPENISEPLKALWYAANDDWEAAHNIAQSKEGTPVYDHLHAYLHRVEGDTWNAGYWYKRAGKPVFKGSLQEEWEALAQSWAH